MTELLGAVLQCVFVFGVAVMLWGGHRLIARLRKKDGQGLLPWLGLTRPAASAKALVLTLGGVFLFTSGAKLVMELAGFAEELAALSKLSSVNDLAALEPGWAAIGAGLAYAFLRTGASEELFFRGVLYKRLVSWFGYLPANLLQAFLFAIMHNALILAALPDTSAGVHVYLFGNLFVIFFVVGWYMEKKDKGSIFFGWLVHGIGNFVAFLGPFLG